MASSHEVETDMTKIMGSMLLVVTCSWFSTVNSQADETWPTYQANASHSGYVPVRLEPQKVALLWKRTLGLGAQVLNPVAAADGKVFVTESVYFNNANLYALDSTRGVTLWTKELGAPFSVNPPAYAYGNVYLQTCNHSTDTYLRAYRADSGAFVFRSSHAAQWERYYAPTVYDGKVYVDGGDYGGLYAFDAYNGTQLWFRGLQQYDEWTPAVDATLAYAYMGSYFPGLYAVDRISGEQVYKIADPNFDWSGWSMRMAPVLGQMDDAVVISNGRVMSFDLKQKKIRWEVKGNFTG